MPRGKHGGTVTGTIQDGRAAPVEEYYETHGEPHARLCRNKVLSPQLYSLPNPPSLPPSESLSPPLPFLAFETDVQRLCH